MKRPDIKFTKIFIDNKFVDSVSGKTFGVTDPATEVEVCRVAEGDAADIDAAVRAARAAFAHDSPWRTMNASQRGRLLYRLADELEKNAEYVASLEALDAGKPIECAFGDVEFAVGTIRYLAGYADKIHGKTIPCNGDVICYTRREPVGVVGAIIPWNYPIDLITLKVASALCTGCCLVVKPAEETPLSALYLAHLIAQVGFPSGVVNVVPGFGETAGAALARHPDVNAVTFTGSTEVGSSIVSAAAATFKRVNLELGGKSPLIIFADAPDLDKAASVAFEAVMENAGQCCVAATRTFVEAPIYEEMLERFRKLAEKRVVGDPFTPGVEQGPQVNETQFSKVMKLIAAGEEEGARLVAGGRRVGTRGFFVAPTVFGEVRDEMRIACEEIFGPVQVVLRFHDVDEVIRRANATHYGLGGGVFTADMDKAHRVAQALEAGTVWINSYGSTPPMQPFGGYKHSGIGREQGKDGLKFFTEVKTISMPISKKNS